MQRRGFLLGLGTVLAAPAVVRADSLMKLWVPSAPKMLTEETLLDAFNTVSMRFRMTETWSMGYDMWCRVYFDEERQLVVTEQVFPERPFVVVPSGKMFLPESAPIGTMITVRA